MMKMATMSIGIHISNHWGLRRVLPVFLHEGSSFLNLLTKVAALLGLGNSPQEKAGTPHSMGYRSFAPFPPRTFKLVAFLEVLNLPMRSHAGLIV
jgi:hypothetical protein